ncbi:MAG: SDR family oxidoreductase [Zoogloeaceae bacterium]|jgi:UDP-glucose 4-epimerase|nr:SDR family oxidoreductase [Zoogloeaceae bacterium]
MKTFWITGARGFIGRHLAKRLAASGHRVAGLGHGNWPAVEANAWGVGYWIAGDVSVSNLAQMRTALGIPDGIFHLAGGSSVGATLTNPHEDFRRTVDSTAELLEWMRQHSPRTPLVAISSAAVYGSGHKGLIPENARPSPYSPYGAHKLMMEELCRSRAANFGLSIALPRLFSVYGPELRKQLLWDVCNKLETNGEAELGGSGSELRDWMHVGDVAAALERQIAWADATAPVFNIATGHPVAVRDVAVALAAASSPPSSPPPIRFSGQSRPGDPQNLCADATRLKNSGFVCAMPLNEGIVEYVTWFRSLKGRP